MESEVSMAFSSAQVISMDNIFSPAWIRSKSFPSEMSFPMAFCPFRINLSCPKNLGTNRKAIDKISESAGISFPNKFVCCHDLVITRKPLNDNEHYRPKNDTIYKRFKCDPISTAFYIIEHSDSIMIKKRVHKCYNSQTR